MTTPTTIALLFSGGLDSSILLGDLLRREYRVRPIYIRSQLVWEEAELAAARRFLAAVESPRLEELVLLEVPLADLYGDHWSVTGRQAPDASTPDEAVYLPGRNALLLVKAALWCRLKGIKRLALAALVSNPFPDATPEFFAEFESALNRATGSPTAADGAVHFWRPFAELDKRRVMELGRGLPLELTFSCISPRGGLHCGQCNKCAERQAAFRLIDLTDPTPYAAPPAL